MVYGIRFYANVRKIEHRWRKGTRRRHGKRRRWVPNARRSMSSVSRFFSSYSFFFFLFTFFFLSSLGFYILVIDRKLRRMVNAKVKTRFVRFPCDYVRVLDVLNTLACNNLSWLWTFVKMFPRNQREWNKQQYNYYC